LGRSGENGGSGFLSLHGVLIRGLSLDGVFIRSLSLDGVFIRDLSLDGERQLSAPPPIRSCSVKSGALSPSSAVFARTCASCSLGKGLRFRVCSLRLEV
jgi:hypothetical protein